MAYITKKTTTAGIKPIGSNLYGTCSTASGTATKVVSMSDFDVLVSGVTIHVQFTNANTASSPMLQVGSTSAVAIKRNGTLEGKWESGSVISFTYDGTNWVQNDADESSGTAYPYVTRLWHDHTNPLTFYFSVRTDSASSVTKSITVEGVSDVSLSASGDSLIVTTQIPSGDDSAFTTSTKTIPLPTDDDTTYTLTKSGSTITLTGSDGSTTSVTDDDTTYSDATILASGLMSASDKIKLNGISSGAEVNQNAFSAVEVDASTGLALIDADSETDTLTLIEGNNVTLTPNTTNNSITITATDTDTTYTISISGNVITLTPSSGTAQTITIPDDDTTYTISASGNTLTLTGSDGSTSTATVSGGGSALEYTIDGASGTYATIQNDVTNNVASGRYAHAEGHQTTASGDGSHAEGNDTTASGDGSHAEGNDTTASGDGSHAEGQESVASGTDSHAEGTGSVTGVNAQASHAQNYHTRASSPYQTAIGKFNKGDGLKTYALIIGNGTSDTARNNALAVTWGGDVEIDLGSQHTATCPTAASTVTKVVTTTDGDFELTSGAYVLVTFTYAPTSNVSLNVDSTGSKAAYYNGSRVNASNGAWAAGDTVRFMYDGTYYQEIDEGDDVDIDIYNLLVSLGWDSDVLS